MIIVPPFECFTVKFINVPESLTNESSQLLYKPMYLHNILDDEEEDLILNQKVNVSISIDSLKMQISEFSVEKTELLLAANDKRLDAISKKLATLFDSSNAEICAKKTHKKEIDFLPKTASCSFHVEWGLSKYFIAIYEKLFPFLLFSIERASFIECEDSNWNTMILYATQKDCDAAIPIGLVTWYVFCSVNVKRVRLRSVILNFCNFLSVSL